MSKKRARAAALGSPGKQGAPAKPKRKVSAAKVKARAELGYSVSHARARAAARQKMNGVFDGVGKSQAHSSMPERNPALLQAFFADESEAFRSPSHMGPAERVTLRLRAERGSAVRVTLLVGKRRHPVAMHVTGEDELFTWYEASLKTGLHPIPYRFSIETAQGTVVYQRGGARWDGGADFPERDFAIVPGFRTPAWAHGAVQYQIFPDRFASGQQGNDVVDREYLYNGQFVRHAANWDDLPVDDDYRCFYGGDLQGVALKLDYLQSLGVEAIYLNPIFVAPSSHKYDTQDYDHVDPHLATIVDDVEAPLPEHGARNEVAHQYIRRTTSAANLESSNHVFALLCQEIHRRGMKVILDGVFNHCGSFSRWMDREGIYKSAGRGDPGAYQSLDSPYRHYFNFRNASTIDYEGWWDFPTLPKLNYEQAPDLVNHIIGIACTWALPPYSIDGWRLDVGADLGHSEAFNHAFWKRFRAEVKGANPDLLIIAEHYGDVSPWLQGDEWDSVMNYDAFMDPLTYFLTGVEKHSDSIREDLYQDGAAFWKTMRTCMARFSWDSLLCAMNELSNHDHSRFLTRTNRSVGRISSAGSAAAGEGIDKRVMSEAVVVQMTWPGAPTIYYGDEAGQVGWTDPDCRRTYPWGNEDRELIELHRRLSRLREQHPSLRTGSFSPLGGGFGWIAFGRFLGSDRMVVICNNADCQQVVSVRLRTLGASEGSKVVSCLMTTQNGFKTDAVELGKVKNGSCAIALPARTAVVAAVK